MAGNSDDGGCGPERFGDDGDDDEDDDDDDNDNDGGGGGGDIGTGRP